MSSQSTYIYGVIIFVLTILIFYTSLVTVVLPSYTFTPPMQQHESKWKGWANIDTIISFGDSYTDTGFDLTEQQPSREDPFGNPTYNPNSPYIKWIEYLSMTYNDSKVETYNFAVSGATVDQDLIDKGSAFSTQVGEKFLSNYGQEDHTWEPQTTLFSVFFGINDNVFSNKSEGLFDRVFESYSRTLDKQQRPLTSNFSQLHTAGAQNFVFLNVPPIHRGPNHAESSSLAESISSWNARLAKFAANLGSTHPETSIFLFDTYDLFDKVLDAPETFEQTRHLGNLKDQCDKYVEELASQETYEKECGLPYDQYFWRDGLHVTFPVHQVLAEKFGNLDARRDQAAGATAMGRGGIAEVENEV
ncbi:MAG: hypothetical protein Q9175_006092, partial [Cornicularia normoerica]